MNVRNLWLHLIAFFFLSTHLSAATIIIDAFTKNVQDSSKINEDTLRVKKTPLKKYVNFDSIAINYWDSMWKVSKSKMNRYLYEDIGDIINILPGAFILDLGSAGQSLGFTRHGAATNQTITYFDGRPLYDPITGESDLNLLPVGFIKELGIGQILSNINFNNNAEILSVKSEKYEGDVPYSQIYHHKAGFGYSDVDFVFGQRIAQKMNILLGGDIKSYDGENSAYIYAHQNFRGKLEYNISPGWRFDYSLLSNKFDRNQPGPLLDSGNFSAQEAKVKIHRYDHTLNISGNVQHADWQNFRANIYYSSLYSKQIDKSIDLKKINESSYAGLNFQMKQKMLGQLITIGGGVEHDWIKTADLGKKKHAFASVFFQNDWSWKEKFGLRGLAFINFHELFGTNFSGGLSSYFKFFKSLKLNLSAQQTLRYPSFIELYAESSEKGSQNLNSEIVQKIETGFESNISKNFLIKTSFYLKNIQHLIRYQVNNSTQVLFQNDGDLQVYGLDFLLDWKLASHFQINTIVSALNNQNLTNFPGLQLSGNIQYNNRFFKDYLDTFIRLEGKYIGERNRVVLDHYSYSSSYKILSPAFIANATAVLGFGKLNIFLMYENILNEDYQIIYGFPMRERNFHYGVRWEFWD